jgi:hypothetical protein
MRYRSTRPAGRHGALRSRSCPDTCGASSLTGPVELIHQLPAGFPCGSEFLIAFIEHSPRSPRSVSPAAGRHQARRWDCGRKHLRQRPPAHPRRCHGGARKAPSRSSTATAYTKFPLGAITSVDAPILFAAGRTADGDKMASVSLRVMGTAFATSRGCGVSAAQFAREGRISDVGRSQQTLGEQAPGSTAMTRPIRSRSFPPDPAGSSLQIQGMDCARRGEPAEARKGRLRSGECARVTACFDPA